MAVQTRNVTVTISDNDGSPLENARVVITLVGLGNEPGGAVAPGPQEKITAANGQVVFELWENNDIYSDTHYEVQSWHPVRGTPIHRRNKFQVPGYDADLEELIALEMADPDPGQRLGNMSLIDGSTVGQNLAQIPNPNAVRFIRINADNTVSVLNAADFRAAIGAGTGGGGIASIALEVPTGLSVTGSPLTSSGTLTITFAAGYSIPTDSKQANWDQAYTDRNKWDGGSTGLNPATGRASLGATTVGSSFFTTANPNAISYARVNANNTVTFVSAATLATELGVTSKLDASAVGVSVASLVGGLVPSNQLPSYVDDVLEFANLGAFPGTGEAGKIYIAIDTNRQYRWSGSSYVQIISSPGTTDNVPEGSTNLYLTQARVRATTLTGFAAAVGLNSVLATDTILAALQKIQGWLNGLGNISTINASTDVLALVGASDKSGMRTALGATTVGSNLFTSPNQSAISFLRINADNTVSYLNATDFRTAIGVASGLAYLVESRNADDPNGTIPAISLAAVGTESSLDLVLSPKGNGALQVVIADNTVVGGNKRGSFAVDLQKRRNSASQVASGEASFIAGSYNLVNGSHSGTIGSANTIQGSYCFSAGLNNTVRSNYSNVFGYANQVGEVSGLGGQHCLVSGHSNAIYGSSGIVSGTINNSSNTAVYYAMFGRANKADGVYTLLSGAYAADRGLNGARVLSSGSDSSISGQSQLREVVLRQQTTDTAWTALKSEDSATAISARNILNLPDNSAYYVEGKVIGRSGSDSKSWKFSVQIQRGTGAASTTIVGTPSVSSVYGTPGSSGWAGVNLSADTTLGGLLVNVSGQTGVTISWTAHLDALEITA